MSCPRIATVLARLVLAWLVLHPGAGGAAVLVQPQQPQLVCAGGIAKPLPAGGDGATVAPAPVVVAGAWARAAMQGQGASGAYMAFTARENLTLTGAASPAAGIIEIHQMKLEGGVMKMRAVDTLALPAGQRVEFKPAGYHFMLMDLKAPFQAGTRIPLTLQFRDAKGAARTLALSVPVQNQAHAGHAN